MWRHPLGVVLRHLLAHSANVHCSASLVRQMCTASDAPCSIEECDAALCYSKSASTGLLRSFVCNVRVIG